MHLGRGRRLAPRAVVGPSPGERVAEQSPAPWAAQHDSTTQERSVTDRQERLARPVSSSPFRPPTMCLVLEAPRAVGCPTLACTLRWDGSRVGGRSGAVDSHAKIRESATSAGPHVRPDRVSDIVPPWPLTELVHPLSSCRSSGVVLSVWDVLLCHCVGTQIGSMERGQRRARRGGTQGATRRTNGRATTEESSTRLQAVLVVMSTPLPQPHATTAGGCRCGS